MEIVVTYKMIKNKTFKNMNAEWIFLIISYALLAKVQHMISFFLISVFVVHSFRISVHINAYF